MKFRAVWFSAEKLCIQINEFFNSICPKETLNWLGQEAIFDHYETLSQNLNAADTNPWISIRAVPAQLKLLPQVGLGSTIALQLLHPVPPLLKALHVEYLWSVIH